MQKIIPTIKVKDLPFFDTLKKVSHEDRVKLGLIHSRGKINEYRRAFILGHGGSAKEGTWSKDKHLHTCCKSRVSWRHKSTCNKLKK